MGEHLYPVGAAVGEQVGVVRARCAEHSDYAPKRGLGACSHVNRLARQRDSMGAVQRSISRSRAAEESAAANGHLTHTWTGQRFGSSPMDFGERRSSSWGGRPLTMRDLAGS